MPATYPVRQPSLIVRVSIALSFLGVVVFGIAWLVTQGSAQAHLERERRQAAWREEEFDRVKQGASSALVLDSALLPMLGSDADCQKSVRHLDFATTVIDPEDAPAVSQLKNVTSMTFYCTRGTKGVLVAAQSLPITAIHFEMPDLAAEEYLLLKDFPQLKHVRFEHVMEDVWIERLKSELPNVVVEAPYLRSAEP